MAITFGPHREKEKRMLLIAIIAMAIGGIIIGVILSRKSAPLFLEVSKPRAPEINWETLSDPRLEKLQPLKEIPPFTEEVGRENPFLPY